MSLLTPIKIKTDVNCSCQVFVVAFRLKRKKSDRTQSNFAEK